MRAKVAIYKDPAAQARPIAATDDDDDDGDSIPEVPLEELLDDLAAMQLEDGEGDAGKDGDHGVGDMMVE
jgi:nonsense-mediated mRNA decay protein 3